MRPAGALGSAPTRVLLALIQVHAREGRATVRGVAAELGQGSHDAAYRQLLELEAAELVELGRKGGLRPLVRPVAR